MSLPSSIPAKIQAIPLGYSTFVYQNRLYGVSRSDFNQGQSLKVFAEALDGSDQISFNCYLTQRSAYLKPCEMPQQKVLAFLQEAEPLEGPT